jgi:hypothetical protein
MANRIKNFTLSASTYDTGVTPGDDVNVKTCMGTEGFTEFCLNLTTGSARVFGSLDGTNFMSKQLVMCQEPPNSGDTISAQDPVFVGVATAGIPAWFFGNYKALRIQQEGATAPVGILSAAGEKW